MQMYDIAHDDGLAAVAVLILALLTALLWLSDWWKGRRSRKLLRRILDADKSAVIPQSRRTIPIEPEPDIEQAIRQSRQKPPWSPKP
jgi:hypothetical protein